ncbi:MAG: ribosome biogenesis GTP-binding protein YihA/YsxC [bacterium]
MKIKKTEFKKSAYDYTQFPRHSKPEIAFSGRSNVGKSSLINTLVNRKKLARISSTPGKTQSINFYNIDNNFYLVDLPGYGFAKVPEKVKDDWAQLIEDYLYDRRNLSGIIQIVDSRHKPTKDDRQMLDWLINSDLSVMLVATKVDKISRNQRKKQKKIILNTLNLTEKFNFTFFSSKTGEGKKKVLGFIQSLIE